MEYVKYINERTIERAPRVIFEESVYIANPTEEILVSHGYKPLVETEMPETGNGEYAYKVYSEEDDKVVSSWVVEQYEEEVGDGEQ